MSLSWPGPHIEWHIVEGRTLCGLFWSQQTKFSLNEYTESFGILYASDFQPVFHGKLVFRERSSGVPQEIW